MKSLSPTMKMAIRRIDLYFKDFQNRPFALGGSYLDVSTSTIFALARRGCCKITERTLLGAITQDVITFENWHPTILDRLARL
jgi:hypothetical protein